MNYDFRGIGSDRLRRTAALAGLDVAGLNEVELMMALMGRVVEHEERVRLLRQECAGLGLTPEVEQAVLHLRLTQPDPGVAARAARRLSRAGGIAFAALGLAALAVGLPHLADQIAGVTGLSWGFGLLLAAGVAGGVCAAILLDGCAGPIPAPSRLMIRGVLIACLTCLAAANATGFVAAGSSPPPVAALCAMALSGLAWVRLRVAGQLLCPRSQVGETSAILPVTYARQTVAVPDPVGRAIVRAGGGILAALGLLALFRAVPDLAEVAGRVEGPHWLFWPSVAAFVGVVFDRVVGLLTPASDGEDGAGVSRDAGESASGDRT